jgi:hypothetical protein
MIEREFARIKPFPDFTWRGLLRRLQRMDRLFATRGDAL